MKLDLGDGQHAELRDQLTYGQARPVREVFARIERGGEAAAMAELDLALVRAFTESWHVLDFAGNAVGLDTPDLAPDSAIQAIALAALDLWRGGTVPKGGPVPLPSRRRGARSA